jgi:hypothetical protein
VPGVLGLRLVLSRARQFPTLTRLAVLCKEHGPGSILMLKIDKNTTLRSLKVRKLWSIYELLVCVSNFLNGVQPGGGQTGYQYYSDQAKATAWEVELHLHKMSVCILSH